MENNLKRSYIRWELKCSTFYTEMENLNMFSLNVLKVSEWSIGMLGFSDDFLLLNRSEDETN